ncbi:MAG: RNA polymerase sigma factor [Thaumarchaeota archaeon]|nr:RNA polymerase sigma factor [Nitrososphaerota archaeon]
MYRLAYSYVYNKENAQDIVQDSICKALTSIRSLKNQASVKAWLYRILVNTAIAFLRKNKNYVYLEADTLEFEATSNDSYLDFDLRNAINKLSTANKTIIVLRFYEGLELREIADITNENLSTVKTRLYSSLRKMGIELDDSEKAANMNQNSAVKGAQLYETV